MIPGRHCFSRGHVPVPCPYPLEGSARALFLFSPEEEPETRLKSHTLSTHPVLGLLFLDATFFDDSGQGRLWGGALDSARVSALARAKLSRSVTWWGKVGDRMLHRHRGLGSLLSLPDGPCTGLDPPGAEDLWRPPPQTSTLPFATAHGLWLSLWLTLSDSTPSGFSIPNQISKKVTYAASFFN